MIGNGIGHGTVSKAYYDDSASYHMPTMELKRNAILGYLESLLQADIDSGFRLNYHGYFRTEDLQNEIAFVMGWVRELDGQLHHEKRIGVDYADTDSIRKIMATVQNMAKKGHIKLSKSGRAFRILDTWRDA